MNRQTANKILEVYGNPKINVGNTKLRLARQSKDDITDIEKLTDDELIKEWKSLAFVNVVVGQVSLSEMQRIDLIELEIKERNLQQGLKEWLEKEIEQF